MLFSFDSWTGFLDRRTFPSGVLAPSFLLSIYYVLPPLSSAVLTSVPVIPYSCYLCSHGQSIKIIVPNTTSTHRLNFEKSSQSFCRFDIRANSCFRFPLVSQHEADEADPSVSGRSPAEEQMTAFT